MSVNMEVQEKNDVEVTEAPTGPPPASVVNGVAPAAPQEPPRQRLVDVPVTDENVALNVMVGFLNMAQRRGSFNFEESAKIAECIKVFTRPAPGQEPTPSV